MNRKAPGVNYGPDVTGAHDKKADWNAVGFLINHLDIFGDASWPAQRDSNPRPSA